MLRVLKSREGLKSRGRGLDPVKYNEKLAWGVPEKAPTTLKSVEIEVERESA